MSSPAPTTGDVRSPIFHHPPSGGAAHTNPVMAGTSHRLPVQLAAVPDHDAGPQPFFPVRETTTHETSMQIKRTHPNTPFRAAMPEAHQALFRMVEGAVIDCFKMHPDYLTDKGKRTAVQSVTKRVVGNIAGHAKQVRMDGRLGGSRPDDRAERDQAALILQSGAEVFKGASAGGGASFATPHNREAVLARAARWGASRSKAARKARSEAYKATHAALARELGV